MKKILIKYENLLKRIFTFKIFNSDEIGRTQYLIYLGLIGLTYFTYQYFLDGGPLFSVSVWVRFLQIILFLLIFIFPVVLLKRLKFLYGDKINFKEFYILGIRSFKINKSSIDTYSLTLLLFILMLLESLIFFLEFYPSLDISYFYLFITIFGEQQINLFTGFINEIYLLLTSKYYTINTFLSSFDSNNLKDKNWFISYVISELIKIYFVYLIFP